MSDDRTTPPEQSLLPCGLTPREYEVLSLITNAHTNPEICEMLFISINTLKSFIRTAYRRIGVKTRSEAILWGAQHGLME